MDRIIKRIGCGIMWAVIILFVALFLGGFFVKDKENEDELMAYGIFAATCGVGGFGYGLYTGDKN